MLSIGLRFSKSQARVLRNLGEDARRAGVGDVGLFFKAAESAQDGEPLVVRCEEADEVHQMAAMFATLGVKRPAVEPLSG